MRKIVVASSIAAALLNGCALLPSPQLSDCLQPNRRVVVEISGTMAKPVRNPSKPRIAPVRIVGQAQGNSAFDPGSAVLKEGGKAGIDRAIAAIYERSMTVGSIVIIGHTDRLEAESGPESLSEDRAKAVAAYLASKGLDPKLMFWEGKRAQEPVAVTKYCGVQTPALLRPGEAMQAAQTRSGWPRS
jgi:outer membrane protein OmpA-like peptidoglycan-associated protein